jgi:hypothetical protein
MAANGVEIAVDAIEVDDTPQSSSQRTRTPSQKARQNQDQLESASTTAAKTSKRTLRTTNGTQAEGRNADLATADATGWQKVLEVVGMTHEEIRTLTQIVAQQQEPSKAWKSVLKRLNKKCEMSRSKRRN